MVLETALAIFSAAQTGLAIYQKGLGAVRDTVDTVEKATKVYDWFSGTSVGSAADAKLQQASHRTGSNIIRLSDRVYADMNLKEAISLDRDAKRLLDPKFMRDILDPVARSIESNVFSSQMSSTPQKLKERFAENPWSVLIDPRPADLVGSPPTSDHIPIMFMHGGQPFIGWQMRGALPQLFNCDFQGPAAVSRFGVRAYPTPAPKAAAVPRLGDLLELIKEQTAAPAREYLCTDSMLISKAKKRWRGTDADIGEGDIVAVFGLGELDRRPGAFYWPSNFIALVTHEIIITWKDSWSLRFTIRVALEELSKYEFSEHSTFWSSGLAVRVPGHTKPRIVSTAIPAEASQFLKTIQRVMG